ncbi:hypothetical protein AB2L27_10815 [Kineococcus sp. LSe6-4]|uniref:MFS transporter n=1 Tax=Kineococcus halophytocola TaxID=3234027 RepID=A0ABV4H1P4_9ACTN
MAGTVRGPLADRAQAVVNAGTGVGVALTGAAVLAAPQVWRPVWVAAAAAAVLTAAVADRSATWPARTPEPSPAVPAVPGPGNATPGSARAAMVRPVLAAAVAGLGNAAVWTFGRDLITTTGGLPDRTSAALWVLLGGAAVLGAASGDAVRLLGLRRSWVLAVALTATATLALAPGQVVLAALTAGQALGASATGALAGWIGLPGAFGVCAAVVLGAALALPGRSGPPAAGTGGPSGTPAGERAGEPVPAGDDGAHG